MARVRRGRGAVLREIVEEFNEARPVVFVEQQFPARAGRAEPGALAFGQAADAREGQTAEAHRLAAARADRVNTIGRERDEPRGRLAQRGRGGRQTRARRAVEQLA